MKAVFSLGATVGRGAIVALLASTAAFSSAAGMNEPALLEPDKAFRISTRALDENHIEVQFAIADGYYMYRDRFKFETEAGRLLANVELPKGKVKEDQFFGKTETYRREVRIRVPVTAKDSNRGSVKLKVTSQGCADVGVCYVPLEQFVEVRIAGISASAAPRGASQAPSWLVGARQVTWSALAKQKRSYVEPWVFPAMLAAFFLFGLVAGFVRFSTVASSGSRRPVEIDLLHIALRFLIYTVIGVAAGVAGNAALDKLPGGTTTMLALSFGGVSVAALATRRAAVAVATSGALLFVAESGSALLGAAGMGLFALSLGYAPRFARWWSTPAAARGLQLFLGFTAAALAIWTASPLIAGPIREFAWSVLLIGG